MSFLTSSRFRSPPPPGWPRPAVEKLVGLTITLLLPAVHQPVSSDPLTSSPVPWSSAPVWLPLTDQSPFLTESVGSPWCFFSFTILRRTSTWSFFWGWAAWVGFGGVFFWVCLVCFMAKERAVDLSATSLRYGRHSGPASPGRAGSPDRFCPAIFTPAYPSDLGCFCFLPLSLFYAGHRRLAIPVEKGPCIYFLLLEGMYARCCLPHQISPPPPPSFRPLYPGPLCFEGRPCPWTWNELPIPECCPFLFLFLTRRLGTPLFGVL